MRSRQVPIAFALVVALASPVFAQDTVLAAVRIDSAALRPLDLSVPAERSPAAVASQGGDEAPERIGRNGTLKSYSSGFFLGGGYEATAIVFPDDGFVGEPEAGNGLGLVVGYGFNRHWSLYGQLSGASIESSDVLGSFGLGHFDIGARVHFLAEDHRVVPFVQFGLGGRAVAADVLAFARPIVVTNRVEAAGAGLAFGAGVNAHFTPGFAFTASFAWSAGNFYDYTVNNTSITGDSISAVSGRLQLGVIWLPGAP